MFPTTFNYTDFYQLTMGQSHFLNGNKDKTVVFDYFFRRLPFKGGYAVFAGLHELLEELPFIAFTTDDLEYLEEQGFHKDFLEYLSQFRFRGNIYSVEEGDLIFPNSPILMVEASVIEAHLLETMLLNLLNFQSLVATKARRIRDVSNGKTILELGLRRAQGLGGHHAAKAAYLGGCDGTSNVLASDLFNIPVSGSMAHAFIQSYEEEIDAFRAFAETHPDNCILLIDTYNTLEQGLPNAITVAKELENHGHRLRAIRLDSGDLGYLSKACRKKLDEAGLPYVKIAASNQIDEHIVKSLEEQEAPIDIYGVGTSLVTGKPDAALDGVYKMSVFEGAPRMKLSETLVKTSLPFKKQVFRAFKDNAQMAGIDCISLYAEEAPDRMYHPFEPHRNLDLSPYELRPMLHPVMINGKPVNRSGTDLAAIRNRSLDVFESLPQEYRRFDFPHEYKTGISAKLMEGRDTLLRRVRK